jgi:hypothetical protein
MKKSARRKRKKNGRDKKPFNDVSSKSNRNGNGLYRRSGSHRPLPKLPEELENKPNDRQENVHGPPRHERVWHIYRQYKGRRKDADKRRKDVERSKDADRRRKDDDKRRHVMLHREVEVHLFVFGGDFIFRRTCRRLFRVLKRTCRRLFCRLEELVEDCSKELIDALGHFHNLGMVKGLNLFHVRYVFFGHEQDGYTLSPEPTRPPNTVNVILAVRWKVYVNHERNLLNVDPACK